MYGWTLFWPWLLRIVLLWKERARRGLIGPAAALCLVLALGTCSSGPDDLIGSAAVRAQSMLPGSPSRESRDAPAVAMPHVNELWAAQPELMAKELDALQPRVAGQANIYAIAVAAQGSQQLFSREAQLALQVAATRFGGNYRGGLLLSNALVDMLRHPLASQDTIAAATRGIGKRIDPTRDVLVVYLTSHGSPDAWIAADLPNRLPLIPISSASLATALAQAGIKRRIVIVSACFSASWIAALANDDTIVITAAAKDRTSFGCDDTRRLTYFGQALLEGPLARGASLRDAFETARTTVTKWETAEGFVPSMPQAFVGRNMQSIWTEGPASRASASRKVPPSR